MSDWLWSHRWLIVVALSALRTVSVYQFQRHQQHPIEVLFVSSTLSVQSILRGRDETKNGKTHYQHSHETQATARSNYWRQFHP